MAIKKCRLFITRAVIIAALAAASGGCMTREMYRLSYIDQDDEWIRMVMDYRKEAARNPDSQEMKVSLKRVEFDASEHFYLTALDHKSAGRLDEAIVSLQKGHAVMPANEKITNSLAQFLAVRESMDMIKKAAAEKKAGNSDEAARLYRKAVELDPSNTSAGAELALLEDAEESGPEEIIKTGKTVTMKFSGADVKTVFDFIGSTFGITVVYDEGAKNLPVSVSVENATPGQAVEAVEKAAGVFHKKIGDTSILVAQDIKAKRDQYDDLIIRTFQLNIIKASDMANILKNTLNLKRVTVNETMNSLSVRDTKDVIELARKVINVNDRKPAEVLFDVEIIEVNRTKAEQLGLNYGSQIKLALPAFANAGTAVSTAFADMLRQGAITLPAFTLNFFKQDVDARMLANPRVRVIEGKKAKIHIGDRVPLRSSIIQDATGQVRYTYDYRDIGVLLEVTPRINMDNSVNVSLRLEVSTLGTNIGTANDPAYSIGTRDAETTMMLKDGETAILGGLIRDEDRKNMMKVPVLGDIPVIGSFFVTSVDETGTRTDVLLTITPRVVRSWEHLDKDLREIYSGTENNLSGKPKYTEKKRGKAEEETGKADETKTAVKEVKVEVEKAEDAVSTAPGRNVFMQSFSEPQYILQSGHEVKVTVLAERPAGMDEAVLKVAFNPAIVSFKAAEKIPGSGLSQLDVSAAASKDGVIELKMKFEENQKAGPDAAEITFVGNKQGVSYLVFLEQTPVDKEGKEINVQRKASRLVVK